MKKSLCLVFLSLLTSQIALSAEIFKENFLGGVFIFDGDEPYLNLKDIPKYSSSNKSTDLIINTLENNVFDVWNKKNAKALTYCVSDKFGAKKSLIVQAVADAAADWMRIANVKFLYRPQHDASCDQTNAKVIFDIRPTTESSYLARAFFPNYPRVNRSLLISSSSYKFDDTAITGFLRHELGHTLGFRHEHISKDSKGLCPENSTFKPITSYDPSSVMHYPQCGGKNDIENMILSHLDEVGAGKVYPF